MKRKNAFTLVELLVCFVLITIVSISLFKTVLVLQKKQQKNVSYNSYVAFTSTLNDLIQKDFLNKIITSFTKCGTNCYDITFDNNATIRLSIDKTNNTITYGSEKQKLPTNYKFYKDLEISSSIVGGEDTEYNSMLLLTIPIKSTLTEDTSDLKYTYQYDVYSNTPIANAVTTLVNSREMLADDTADKNLRYSGEDPNNYVYFNCSAIDESSRTYGTSNYDYEHSCEKWRIIGIFNVDNGEGVVEQRVKIIRDTIGSYSWDTTPSGVNEGYGYNIWETKTSLTPKSSNDSSTKADVNRLLNEWYLGEEDSDDPVVCYNARYGDATADPQVGVIGCPSNNQKLKTGVGGQDLIDDAVWNLGGTYYTNANGYAYNLPVLDTYNKERGTLTGNGFSEVAKTEWIGKVALPYVTDFAYASINSECRSDARAGAQADSYKCTKALGNWMHNSTNYWTILPLSGGTSNVFFVYSGGLVTSGSGACNARDVRPVVYLKSGTRITGNTGSSDAPYKLGL